MLIQLIRETAETGTAIYDVYLFRFWDKRHAPKVPVMVIYPRATSRTVHSAQAKRLSGRREKTNFVATVGGSA